MSTIALAAIAAFEILAVIAWELHQRHKRKS
jgi:hypothetical protein